jgi:hypothetical protein
MTERIERFLLRLEHLNVDDLQVLALSPADPDEREALLNRIDDAARAGGRLEELDEAADRAYALVVDELSFRSYEPSWFGLKWLARSRSSDRIVFVQVVEDAAMAAVVADLVPDDAALLGEPFELLASMVGTAPSANPTSDRHRNLVRAMWLLAASTWLGTMAVAVVALVVEIIGARPCAPDILC